MGIKRHIRMKNVPKILAEFLREIVLETKINNSRWCMHF